MHSWEPDDTPHAPVATFAWQTRRVKRPSLPPTVVALAIVSLLHDLAGDMVTPLVPMLVATMGSGPAVLGLIDGIADATASLLNLVSGHLADR